jgi:hypothetical protein
MRSILLAWLLCVVTTVSVFAQPVPSVVPQPGTIDPDGQGLDPDIVVVPGPPPGLPPGKIDAFDRKSSSRFICTTGLTFPTVPVIPDKELVGLESESRLELLTWERVYALVLTRSRDSRGGYAEALDPKTLAAQAARLGVADFDRFRKDFLAARLRRLQMIDNARKNIYCHENLSKLIAELSLGTSFGLSPLDLDRVNAALLEARRGLSDEIGQFRDQLDEVKVALGLSPHAPVIPDRQSLATFRTAFEAVQYWFMDPDRAPYDMRKLTHKLPTLGKVVVDRNPILGAFEGEPEPGEAVLANAVRIALKNRVGLEEPWAGDETDTPLEVRVRRHIRNLFQTRQAYHAEKRNYEFATRLRDQSLEHLVAPSTASVSGRSQLLVRLLAQFTQIWKVEDRLVTLATSFRAERLALYRDLGSLPYADWASFYRDLSAE